MYTNIEYTKVFRLLSKYNHFLVLQCLSYPQNFILVLSLLFSVISQQKLNDPGA